MPPGAASARRRAAASRCSARTSATARASCYRARRRAEAAHLLVVNHALLLSDLATGGNVLPEYKHLVVDEAHHLEEEATRQFGFTASEADLLDWLDAVYARAGRDREGGLVSTLYTTARASQGAIGVAPQLQSLARTLSQASTRARDAVPAFLRAIQDFGAEARAAAATTTTSASRSTAASACSRTGPTSRRRGSRPRSASPSSAASLDEIARDARPGQPGRPRSIAMP